MENGFYQISNSDYHGGEGYSRSDLTTILKHSYSHYKCKKDNPQEPTPAMQLGTLFHQLILEPNKFYDWNITPCDKPIMPEFSRSKVDLSAKEEWKNSVLHNYEKSIEGKTIVKKDMWDQLHLMKDSLMENAIIRNILTDKDTIYESSWFYNDPSGFLLKCRTDIYSPNHNIIIDLKTTIDGSFNSFRKDVANYSYHVQSWMYSYLLGRINKKLPPVFIFAVVEKNSPFAVSLYKLDDPSLEVAEELFHKAIKKLKDDTNRTYPQTIQDMNLPAWAFDLDSI